MELGAREFIQKPTDIEGFIAAVCGIIERWAGHHNENAHGA